MIENPEPGMQVIYRPPFIKDVKDPRVRRGFILRVINEMSSEVIFWHKCSAGNRKFKSPEVAYHADLQRSDTMSQRTVDAILERELGW